MKVDFRNLPVRDIEGNLCPRDIAKELGNMIYNETADIGELDLAQRIYREGCVDLTDEETQTVRRYVEKNYKAFVKRALDEAVEEARQNSSE